MNLLATDFSADGRIATLSVRGTEPVHLLDETVLDEFETAIDAARSAEALVVDCSRLAPDGMELTEEILRSADQRNRLIEHSRRLADLLRRLETERPAVAVVEGRVAGVAWEVALACRRRVAVDHSSTQCGLDRLQFGRLPMAGGISRLTRRVGIDLGIELVEDSRLLGVVEASDLGLIDAVESHRNDAIPTVESWLSEGPIEAQPWDRPGFELPGGEPSSLAMLSRLPSFPARLRKRNRCVEYGAPIAALSVVVEGGLVNFDAAIEIERRYLKLVLSQPTTANLVRLQSNQSCADGEEVLVEALRAAMLRALRTEVEVLAAEGVASASIARAFFQSGFGSGLHVQPENTSEPAAFRSPASLGAVRTRLENAAARAVEAMTADRDSNLVDVASVRAGFPDWTGGALRRLRTKEPLV
jgi:3-hydroxyacyl-CoA dehydrogenase/enoyl-CoA hydratase/3-hydroxybutyryl-CoA epimerase